MRVRVACIIHLVGSIPGLVLILCDIKVTSDSISLPRLVVSAFLSGQVGRNMAECESIFGILMGLWTVCYHNNMFI